MPSSDRQPLADAASHRPLPTLGLLPVLAISAVVAGGAEAQTTTPDTQDLGTILLEAGGPGGEAANSYKVTEGSSKKLTAELVDTPKTVQIITQKQMAERGASSVYDVLRTTPGVTLGTGEGGNPMGDRPFIRGYEASTDMMVDGVRALGRNSYEAFNLESIELVKGAAGAYSGRGGAGGSLNMVSKSARLGEDFNIASLSLGTDSQKRAQLDSNLAFGENAAARLNLFAQDGEVPGRGGIKDDKLGFAGAVTAKVGDATTVTANVYFSRAESMPDFGIPMANDAYVALTGDTRYGTGTTADPYRPLDYLNHDQFFGLFNRDFRTVYNRSASVGVEHEFDNGLTFSARLTQINNSQAYIVTRPTLVDVGGVLTFDRSNRNGHRKNEVTAFNADLSGETELAGMTHSWVIGTEISQEKLRSGSIAGIGGGTMRTPDWQNPDAHAAVNMSGVSYNPLGAPTTTKSKSIYFFDTVEFNDQWQGNFGLRYESFDVYQNANGLGRTDNIWSYQAGVVYKPVENASIYASFSTSASPSGQCAGLAGGSEGAGACTLTANNEDLAPEKTRAFEIGTKWDLMDDRLQLTAALFRTEKTNARVTDDTGAVDTVGANRAQGIELGVNGMINDRWAMSAGYTYTDTEITNAGFVNIGGNGQGGNPPPNYVPSPNNGNEMHYIAKHSFAFWTTYEVDDQWTIGGGATYVGKRFVNADNTAQLPASWRVDLMTSYKLNDKASIQLNVNNVFDEKIYDASHVGLFANVQAGRSAMLKLNYEF